MGAALEPVSFNQPRPRARGRDVDRVDRANPQGKVSPTRTNWGSDEKRILLERYLVDGEEACREALGGKRSLRSIGQKARKLGLKRGRAVRTRLRRQSSDDLDRRIREGWAELEGRGAVMRLADHLGVPRWWLTRRAAKLKLSVPRLLKKEPPWSGAEELLLG